MKQPIVTLVIAATLVFALIFGANSCESSKCENVGQETGRKIRYDIVNGCRIEDKGKFVPLDRWRVIDE